MVIQVETLWESRFPWRAPRSRTRRGVASRRRYSIPLCTLWLVVSPPASSPSMAQAVWEGVLSAAVKHAIVVAGAAFAPAAIGVLNRSQPFTGSQNVSFAIVFARRPQTAQRETGSVDVVDAPAAIPAPIRLLRLYQVIDAALDGFGSRVSPCAHRASSTRPLISAQVGSSMAL